MFQQCRKLFLYVIPSLIVNEQLQKRRIVLLSPACASFDGISCFEHRGRVFCELIQNTKTSEKNIVKYNNHIYDSTSGGNMKRHIDAKTFALCHIFDHFWIGDGSLIKCDWRGFWNPIQIFLSTVNRCILGGILCWCSINTDRHVEKSFAILCCCLWIVMCFGKLDWVPSKGLLDGLGLVPLIYNLPHLPLQH